MSIRYNSLPFPQRCTRRPRIDVGAYDLAVSVGFSLRNGALGQGCDVWFAIIMPESRCMRLWFLHPLQQQAI
jgi:hypothetical protein